jgi:hypothetical protein
MASPVSFRLMFRPTNCSTRTLDGRIVTDIVIIIVV